MSYGWLTESSLVPKPGKPIENVPAKSLAGLRSLMLEKQEEAKKRKLETGVSVTKPTKKFRPRMELRAMESNIGVAAREEKDAAVQAESIASFEKSRKRLEEKSKLYDAIVSGALHPAEVTDVVDVPGNAKTFKGKSAALCLDVEAKRDQAEKSCADALTGGAASSAAGDGGQAKLRSRLEELRASRRRKKGEAQRIDAPEGGGGG